MVLKLRSYFFQFGAKQKIEQKAISLCSGQVFKLRSYSFQLSEKENDRTKATFVMYIKKNPKPFIPFKSYVYNIFCYVDIVLI